MSRLNPRSKPPFFFLSLFFFIASIAKKKEEETRNRPVRREANSRQKQPPLSFMQGKSTSRKKDDTPGLC